MITKTQRLIHPINHSHGRHLGKQNELLMDAYRHMSHELHRLQVEEEMLMRKYYELMVTQRSTKKNEESSDVRNDKADDDQAGALARVMLNTT